MTENDILESCLTALQKGASLASCLEKHPELGDETIAILQAAIQFRAVGQSLTPDPAFKRRSRNNLMHRIAAEQTAPGGFQRLIAKWQELLASLRLPVMRMQPLAALLIIALTLALGAGIVSAAQNALPGAPLYPIKRLSEQARSALKQDDILWQLTLAQSRLEEATRLGEANSADSLNAVLADYTAIIAGVDQMIGQKIEADDLANRQKIYQILSGQMKQLQQLQEQVSGHEEAFQKAIDAVVAAMNLLYPPPQATPTPTLAPTLTIQRDTPTSAPIFAPTMTPAGPSQTPQPTAIPTLPSTAAPQLPATPSLPTVMPSATPALPTATITSTPPPSPAATMPPSPTMQPPATAIPTQAPATAMPTQPPTPTAQPPATTLPTPTLAPPTAVPPTVVPATITPPAPPLPTTAPPSPPSWP